MEGNIEIAALVDSFRFIFEAFCFHRPPSEEKEVFDVVFVYSVKCLNSVKRSRVPQCTLICGMGSSAHIVPTDWGNVMMGPRSQHQQRRSDGTIAGVAPTLPFQVPSLLNVRPFPRTLGPMTDIDTRPYLSSRQGFERSRVRAMTKREIASPKSGLLAAGVIFNIKRALSARGEGGDVSCAKKKIVRGTEGVRLRDL